MQLPGFTAELVLGDRGRSHFASVGHQDQLKKKLRPNFILARGLRARAVALARRWTGCVRVPDLSSLEARTMGPICVDTVIHYAPCT